MDFRPKEDTLIRLDLTDHRGRRIRASMAGDLRVWVWTQDPNLYLFFNHRDVKQGHDEDFLVIPDHQMAALQPGVVFYRYSFREFAPDAPHGHYERTQTVTTDFVWRGMNPGVLPGHPHPAPANPATYQAMEHLKELIEQVYSKCERSLKEMRAFLAANYTDALSDEITRATEAERTLRVSLESLQTALEEETKRSNQVDIKFLEELNKVASEIEALQKRLSESESSASGSMEQMAGSFAEALQELRKALENRIDEALTQKALKDSEQDVALSQEVATRKVEEERLDTRINNVKGIIDTNDRLYKERLADVESILSKVRKKAKNNRAALDIINGDENTPGSIKHAMKDCKHYTDDRDELYWDKIKTVSEATVREWFR